MAEQEQTVLFKLLINKRYSVFRHAMLIVALVLITLNYSIPHDYPQLIGTPLYYLYTLGLFLTFLIPSYFNFNCLMPGYLLTKRYLAYFISLSALVVVMLVAQYFLEAWFCGKAGVEAHQLYNYSNKFIFILNLCGGYFLNLIAFTGLSATLLFRYWIADNQRAGQLESEHLQTQVENLKQQVDPGFLFNTINRIALIGQSDTALASNTLLKFSKLLRYQLYDSNRKEVLLTSEIQFINDYLTLEQLYYQRLRYQISVRGDVSCLLVPPMLFVPFIRQFMDGMKDGDAHANLSLEFFVEEENGISLTFNCTSDIKAVLQSEQFNGIRQRLRLLFGNGYSLNLHPPPFIIPDGGTISLTLNLK